jgi:hypothetical protein
MPLHADTLGKYRKGDTFVETGTFIGDGIRKALAAGFKRVVSIEVQPTIAEKAKAAFASDPRVEIITGDSKLVLPEVIKTITGAATFWLDAHWLDGYEQAETRCPLYDELQAIKGHACKSHAILIDDMSMMGTTHSWGKGMQVERIKSLLMEINPDYKLSNTDSDNGAYGMVKNDILVATIPTKCLVYTVRNAHNDLHIHLPQSLRLVRDNLLPFVPDLDIVFFWDGGTVPIIQGIIDSLGIKNRVFYQEFTCGQPAWATGNKSYNNMCRFWAGLVFYNPVVSKHEWYMRLDCDSSITAPIGRDPFEEVKTAGAIYGYLTDGIQHDNSPYSKDLNKTIKEFESQYKGEMFDTIDNVREGLLYYTNFEICKVAEFRKPGYEGMFRHIDANGGIYRHRWGDHIIRYAGLRLFYPRSAAHEIKGVSYTHQSYVLINGVRQVGK